MSVKTFNTRVKNKIDVDRSLIGFRPLLGELVIGGSSSQNGKISTNQNDDPYIAKIGDGVNLWEDLPSIGNSILKGESCTVTNLGSGVGQISLTIPSGDRRYAFATINTQSGIDELNIVVSGTNPMLSEHYLLIHNNGNSDIWLASITGTFDETLAKVHTRQDYITAGDICELQIKVFKLDGGYVMTAIPQLGIHQAITVSNGENVWEINRN